jgi:hypothetical protein
MRFHTTLRVHQGLLRIRWYKKWHEFRYHQHVHVAALIGYIIAIVFFYIASFYFQGPLETFAASGTFTQPTTAFTGNGTFTNTSSPSNNIALAGGTGFNGYAYQKQLVFNTSATGANVSSNQTSFPISVDIKPGATNNWSASDGNNFFGAWNVSGKRVQFFDGNDSVLTVTAGSRSSNVVTLTTSVSHGYAVGDRIQVSNVAGFSTSVNGGYTITAVTSNTISFAQTAGNETPASVSGNLERALMYEVDYYNSSTPEAIYWVKVPQVDGNTTTDSIYVSYGNDPNSSNQDQATSVWNANYKLVSHDGGLTDSTATPTTGTNHSTTQTTGYINSGTSYNGSAYITDTDDSKLRPTTAYTMSGWVKRTAQGTYQRIWSNAASSGGSWYGISLLLQVTGTNTYKLYASKSTLNYDESWTSAQYTDNQAYHYVTLAWDGTNIYFGFDGVMEAGQATSRAPSYLATSAPAFGALNNSGYIQYLTGNIDEFRLSNSARNSDYTKLEYYSTKTTNWVGDSWLTWGTQSNSYVVGGTNNYTTNAIAPSGLYGNWGTLNFVKCDSAVHSDSSCTGTYTNTTLTVDVLNGANGNVLSSNVASGTNLNLPVDPNSSGYSSIKLRVNLSTTNSLYTPTLTSWSLGYSYDTVLVPQGLNYSNVTNSPRQIQVNWTAPSASTPASSAILSFKVQRASDSSGTPGAWAAPASGGCSATITVGSTSCVDSDPALTANTKYYYRLQSSDINGNVSGWSGSLTADSDTLGLWHMQSATSGSIANSTTTGFEDSSGNGNNGTVTNTNGSGMSWNSGKTGNGGVTFDGIDDKVTMTTSVAPIGTGDFTVEAWVQTPMSGGPYGGIISKGFNSGASNANSWGLAQYSSSTNRIGFYDVGNSTGTFNASVISPSGSPLSSGWHYVAVTRSGTTYSLYVDNNAPVTQTATAVNLTNSLSLKLGSTDNGVYFGGGIGDVRISRVARTQSQLQTNYYAEALNYPKSQYTAMEAPSGITFSSVTKTGLTATATGSFSNLTSGTSGLCFSTSSSSCTGSWQQTTSISPLLAANTQQTYYALSRNGDSTVTNVAVGPASKYTTAADPNVTADKSTGTWYNSSIATFTNAGGFGSGGVAKYKYVWDQTTTHSFSNDGTDWNSSTLPLTMAFGSNYLHVQSYNGDGVAASAADYGPFKYDNVAPSGTNFAWTSVGQNSISVTVSGAGDGAGSGMNGAPYRVQCTNNSKTFDPGHIDFDSTWTSTSPIIINSLSSNTAYACRFAAQDAIGNSTAWLYPGTSYKYTLIQSATGVSQSSATSTSVTMSATGTLTNVGSDSSGLCFSTSLVSCTNSGTDWVQNTPPSYTLTNLPTGLSSSIYLFTRNGDGIVNAFAGPYTIYTLPGSPNGLSTTAITSTSIDLQWYAPSGGTPNHYHLYRNGTKTEIASGTTYTDSGLTPNTQYTYVVKAVNLADGSGGQEGSPSASLTRYTLATEPSSPTASAIGNTQINTSWTAPADSSASKYHVYRVLGSLITQVGGDIAGTSYTDTGLAANTQYTYRIYSVNSDTPALESATYASVQKYTLNDTPVLDTPTTPTNVSKPAITNSTHANANFAGRTAYLYDNGGSAIAIVQANSSGVFTFGTASYSYDLSDGSHSNLTVKVDNSDSPTGFSSASTPVTILVATQGPGVPTGFAASNVTSSQATLSWTAPSAGDATAQYYLIQRAPDSSGSAGSWTTIKDQIGLSNLSWTDSGLSGNTKYWYQIKAYDNAGNNSAYSSPISAITQTGNPTNLTVSGATSTAISISWSAPSTGAASYNIYRDGASSPTAYVNSPTTTWSDSGLTPNTTHTYIVKANNAANGAGSNSTDPNPTVSKYTLAVAPGSISATAAANTEIDLTWTAVPSGTTGGFHLYRIQGSTTTQVGGTISSGAITYSDTGLAANTQYTYRIYSVNSDTPALESATYASVQKYTLTNTPTIESISSPTNNNQPTVTNSSHADLSFAGRTVKLFVDGNWFNNITVTAASNGIFTFSKSSYSSNVLADGNHSITAVVMSQENEASPQSSGVTVLVDTVVPSTAVSQTPSTPNGSPDATYYRSVPTISLALSNPVSGVGNTIFYKWDAAVYSTYSASLTNLAQGTHILSWYSQDAAGNTEAVKTKTYKLDSVAPAGNVTIASGSYSSLNPVVVDLAATDATSGVDEVYLSNDNVSYCQVAYTSSIVWDFEGNLSDPANLVYGGGCGNGNTGDGVRTIYAKYTDKAGNVGSVASATTTLDTTAPTNSTAVAHPSASDSSTFSSGEWHNYSKPVFDLSGATDNLSGVAGYFVYFGTNQNAEPITDGTPIVASQSGTTTFAPNLSNSDSGNTFYLKVRTADNAGNFFGQDDLSASTLLFTYKFDNTAPDAISYVNPNPGGWSATNNFSFTWQNVNDNASGVVKYYYRRKTDPNADSWEGWDASRSLNVSSKSAGDEIDLNNIEALFSGIDVIQVKAIDAAANESATVQVNYYYSGDIPAPTNLHPDLSQSQNQTVNRFSFSWNNPAGITPQGYYYSVNRIPDAQNATFIPYTSGSTVTTGFSAFATQSGLNTFYVVTKANDTVGWSNYVQTNFTCNTAAPGIPKNVMITDSSARESERWQLTINWDQPDQVTPDFNGYSIERSTDGTNFSEIATTARQTTGYLDTNLLNSVTYYYRVKAKDNTGSKSAASTAVSKQPTGRFTEPPKIIGDPKIDVQATKATVTYTTERDADSFIQIGTTTNYGMTQGQLDATSTHEIKVSGLTPGTFYHYRGMWRDIDGNIGYSKDYTFKTQAAPGISEVNVSDIGLSSAIISWKTTTVASSTVYYGTSTSYGQQVEDLSTSGTTTHVVKIDGLADSTTYHFRIHGTDVEGNVLASDDYSFETLTYPKVSDLKVTQPIDTATATFVVTWTTNVPTDSSVTCQAAGSGSKQASKSMLETKHSVIVDGLYNDTNYVVSVGGRDGYGNSVQGQSTTLKTLYDTRPPIISNIVTETSIVGYGSDAKAQVIVSWDTDKPGTSQVQYDVGVSGDTYTQKTQEDNSLTTTHVVVISGLKPSTSYHFQVISADFGKLTATSDDSTFLTDQANSSVLDIVVNSLQSTIGWIFGAFGRK